MRGLFGILPDSFEVGANWLSNKPVIYIDPNKIDAVRMNELREGIDASKPETTAAYQKFAADQIRQQLETQMPGVTLGTSDAWLAQKTESALRDGPFSMKSEDPAFCVVNEPLQGLISKSNIVQVLTAASADKFKSLPGTQQEWDYLAGAHESSHCSDPGQGDSVVSVWNEEITADRAALNSRSINSSVRQAFIDLRTINAMTSTDIAHATGYFLNDPGKTVTEADLQTVTDTRYRAIYAVKERQDITFGEAEKLLRNNPAAFNKTLQSALEEGEFSKSYALSPKEMEQLVKDEFKRLEIATGDLSEDDYKMARDSLVEDLDKQGKLSKAPPPDMEHYIKQYLEASDRRLLPADTPAPPKAEMSSEADVTADTPQPGAAPYAALSAYESVIVQNPPAPPVQAAALDYDPLALYASVTQKPAVQAPVNRPAGQSFS
jgi:hypothetical protein